MRSLLTSPRAGLVLTSAIVVLTLITANVHLSLGELLFLLNALGYIGLAGLLIIGYLKPHPLVERFDWFPRVSLMGYAATTIVGYLIIGPYSTLGWITKAIEVVIIGLVALDIVRVYGGPRGVVRTALASVFGARSGGPAEPGVSTPSGQSVEPRGGPAAERPTRAI